MESLGFGDLSLFRWYVVRLGYRCYRWYHGMFDPLDSKCCESMQYCPDPWIEQNEIDPYFQVMPQFKKTFGLPEDKKATADIVSNVVSTLQAGCFLGALIAFYIADKWGRRVSFAIMSHSFHVY